MVWIAVFFLGVAAGRQYPDPAPLLGPAHQHSPVVPITAVEPNQPPEPSAEAESAQLLDKIVEQKRLLLREQENRQQAEREARITYNLLRGQGYAEGAPVCREQLERRQRCQADLVRLKEQLAELERLEISLREVVRQEAKSEAHVDLDRELRSRVKACLLRRSLLTEAEALLPAKPTPGQGTRP
jgi:hypothetical protein